MFKTLKKSVLIFFIITSSVICAETEKDLNGCIEDLNKLGKTISDVIRSAEAAESAHEELENKKDELKNCMDNPDVQSPTWDNCEGLRSEYKAAQNEYNKKINSLELELEKIASKIRAVEWSCGGELGYGSAGKSKNTVNINCEILKNLKEKLPIKDLLDLCKKYIPEAECKKCLEIEP